MEKTQKVFQYTIRKLKKKSIKHEYRHFSSGAIMLDIWHNDKFYVIQFEDFIGISEIDSDNVGFDTMPDEKFFDEISYKIKLDIILDMGGVGSQ